MIDEEAAGAIDVGVRRAGRMSLIASRSRVVISEVAARSEVERLSLSDRFLVLVQEMEDLRAETRAMNEAWSQRRAAIDQEMGVLRRRLARGASRPLECPVLYDFEAKRRIVKHPVTGAVIEDAPMNESDWNDARAQGIAP